MFSSHSQSNRRGPSFERITERVYDQRVPALNATSEFEPPPSYEESERSTRSRTHSRQSSKSPARPRSPDPNNADDVWELVDDLLKAKVSTASSSSRPMEELNSASSTPFFNAQDFHVRKPGKSSSGQDHVQTPRMDIPPQSAATRSGIRDNRDSGYYSDASATLVGDDTQAAPKSGLHDPPATRDNKLPTLQPEVSRCRGKLTYKDSWVQEFGCSECKMSQSSKHKTLKVVHHPQSREVLHLNQRRVRAYHIPVPKQNYQTMRNSNLLCKICYKDEGIMDTYRAEELAQHFKQHKLEDLKIDFY